MGNREGSFGLGYSWDDLAPVRPLVVTVILFQALGAAASLWLDLCPDRFRNIWSGAALAMFPGFLVGLLVQRLLQPGSLSQNLVMVSVLGLGTLLFFGVALGVTPLEGVCLPRSTRETSPPPFHAVFVIIGVGVIAYSLNSPLLSAWHTLRRRFGVPSPTRVGDVPLRTGGEVPALLRVNRLAAQSPQEDVGIEVRRPGPLQTWRIIKNVGLSEEQVRDLILMLERTLRAGDPDATSAEAAPSDIEEVQVSPMGPLRRTLRVDLLYGEDGRDFDLAFKVCTRNWGVLSLRMTEAQAIDLIELLRRALEPAGDDCDLW